MKRICVIFCLFVLFENFDAQESKLSASQIPKSSKSSSIVRGKIAPIDFCAHDMKSADTKGVKALIMSGIQGDEPGAFNATNLLLQHYTITKGRVRVIPSLSPHSMFFDNRGIYGDMNRKFAKLDSHDPEFDTIAKIKQEILSDEIDVIFHMHDGSGFYRPEYINELLNPRRWGNSSIIDEEMMKSDYKGKFVNISQIAQDIANYTNAHLLKPLHKYHVKNTYTMQKDKEMQKSLTYFAYLHNKPAFAYEASKSLKLEEKVYYHLLGIEGFLRAVGVEFSRNFELTPSNVKMLLQDKSTYISIDSRITLPTFNLKPVLNFFPFPKGKQPHLVKIDSSSYIMGLAEEKNAIAIKQGNQTLSFLKPLFIEFSHDLEEVNIRVDEVEKKTKIGSKVSVKNSFYLHRVDGYRANVIGFLGDVSSAPQEFDMQVNKAQMMKKFSIDRGEHIYRVEIYKNEKGGEKFAGMILVEFE